ncbi:MAG: hypothetical protein RIT03_580 [Bacteroidota bacterium]|jgi:hypothetical protein
MRKIASLLILLPILSNCDKPINEQAAIIDLLNNEAATWRAADPIAHAACWDVKPYGKIIISTADGQVIELSSEQVVNAPKSAMGKGGKAILSDFSFSIQDQSAWVSHTELSIDQAGDSTRSKEIRLLEKINGDWKLVGQSIHVLGKK